MKTLARLFLRRQPPLPAPRIQPRPYYIPTYRTPPYGIQPPVDPWASTADDTAQTQLIPRIGER